MEKYSIDLDDNFESVLSTCSKRNLKDFQNEQNKHLATDSAIDLLNRMLIYDHNQRILPSEALEHPYFDEVR